MIELTDENVRMMQELGRARMLDSANDAKAELDALKKDIVNIIKLREYPEIWKVLEEVHRTIFYAALCGDAVVYDLRIGLPPYSPDEVTLEVSKLTREGIDRMDRQIGLLRESIECLSNEAAYTAEKMKELHTAMKGQQ